MITATLTPASAALMLTHSPAHAWRQVPENPHNYTPAPWNIDLKAMAAHWMVAQPAEFAERFTLVPGRMSGEQKLPSGRTMLSGEDYKAGEAMAERLQNSGGRCGQLIRPELEQAPEYWQTYTAELAAGVMFEGVAHTYHAEPNLLVMHHPVREATIDQCMKVLANRLHVATAMLTMRAMVAEMGLEAAPILCFVMQQHRWPHDAIAVAPDDDWLQLAGHQADTIIETAQRCLEADAWPLAEAINVVSAPGWAKRIGNNAND